MTSVSLERNGSEIFDEVSPRPDKADPIAKPASQSSLFRLMIAASTKLFFDEKLEPNFGAHVVENLSKLYSDFKSRGGED